MKAKQKIIVMMALMGICALVFASYVQWCKAQFAHLIDDNDVSGASQLVGRHSWLANAHIGRIGDRMPAICYAAEVGRTEFVSLLLDAGAMVNAHDRYSLTALHWAAERNDTNLVSLLLSKGADPRLSDINARTPFDHAGSQEVEAIIEKYLRHDSGLEAQLIVDIRMFLAKEKAEISKEASFAFEVENRLEGSVTQTGSCDYAIGKWKLHVQGNSGVARLQKTYRFGAAYDTDTLELLFQLTPRLVITNWSVTSISGVTTP